MGDRYEAGLFRMRLAGWGAEQCFVVVCESVSGGEGCGWAAVAGGVGLHLPGVGEEPDGVGGGGLEGLQW